MKYISRYFFFQEEDGIRDLTVTGVQTCSLPILFVSTINRQQKGSEVAVDGRDEQGATGPQRSRQGRRHGGGPGNVLQHLHAGDHRSEERRVGKEGRSRWWPDP